MTETAAMERKVFEALKPPAKLSLTEWSDKHAYLSAESAAEPGKWRTLPYQKGIMNALTNPRVAEVWVKKSARIGWTKIINNFAAYHIHQDPCTMMIVQPTIEDGQGYSKEEFAPMVRDTPVLQGLVADVTEKDGSNTILSKSFPGGVLGIVGANSGRGFRRVSRRVVLFDEIDGYPPSAGTEGDQLKLGAKRAEYYWNRKIAGGSTPLEKDTSRIERKFLAGDQRQFVVPCPSCDHGDYLVFRENKEDNNGVQKGHHMVWPKSEPEKAHFVCSKNGCVIEEKDKRWMIEEADRRQEADEHCGYGWVPQNPQPKTDKREVWSFAIWAAYSYSPNASWGALAQEFLDAKDNPEELKTFVNTALGETWESEYSAKVNAEGLRGRAEFYTPSIVPAKCLIATAGIDVQANRIECTIYGWAPGEESWVISHDEIFGDPSQAAIWKQVDTIVYTKLKRDDNKQMPISVAAIDTGGHHTHEVYQYTRERRNKSKDTMVIGVKGQSQRNKPAIGKGTLVDINMRNQTLKGGAIVYPMGSDTIKEVLYGRFKLIKPGAGFVHFHTDLGPEFFEQLTSEKQVTKYVKGQPVKEWILKSGKRNEALDCAVMAYAALQYLYTKFQRKTLWAQFAKRLGLVMPKPGEEPVVPAPETTESKGEQANLEPGKEETGQNKPQQTSISVIKKKGGGFIGRF